MEASPFIGSPHTMAPLSEPACAEMILKKIWPFLVLLALGLIQVAVYYPQLPETLAVHFNWRGDPNGWSSRETFFFIEIGLLTLLTLVAIFAPIWSFRPGMRFHLPNKEFWFAAERKAETIAWIESSYRKIFLSSMVLMLLVCEHVLRANLGAPVQIDSGLLRLALAVYFFLVFLLLVSLFRRFRKTNIPH
jgi:hypothetical protein